MNLYQITQWSHELFRLQVQEGGIYIDATMGKGRDTLFLCEMETSNIEGSLLDQTISEASASALPGVDAEYDPYKAHSLPDTQTPDFERLNAPSGTHGSSSP